MHKRFLYGRIFGSLVGAYAVTLFFSSNFGFGVTDTNGNVLGAQRGRFATLATAILSPTHAPAGSPSPTPSPTSRITRSLSLITTKTPSSTPTKSPTSTPIQPTQSSNQSTTQSGSVSSLEAQTISLINGERSRQGLGQLSTNGALTEASRRHAKDMCDNNHFDHTGTDGSTFSSRAKDAGYAGFAYGEVIGWQHTSAESIFNGWMQSPPHHDIILNSGVTNIGVGWVGSCIVGVVGS